MHASGRFANEGTRRRTTAVVTGLATAFVLTGVAVGLAGSDNGEKDPDGKATTTSTVAAPAAEWDERQGAVTDAVTAPPRSSTTGPAAASPPTAVPPAAAGGTTAVLVNPAEGETATTEPNAPPATTAEDRAACEATATAGRGGADPAPETDDDPCTP